MVALCTLLPKNLRKTRIPAQIWLDFKSLMTTPPLARMKKESQNVASHTPPGMKDELP